MRSHYCGQVNESLIDQEVELCGWVDRRRDHGGVIFIDLRDIKGLVQIVVLPQHEIFNVAEAVRGEFVIRVKGKVNPRPSDAVNAELPSGQVEVIADQLEILNEAETPPFRIDEFQDIGEDIRLRYRYIDLRRPEMQSCILFRAKAIRLLRQFLDEHHFIDIETPFLTKSTPEGARDYLVPSRVNPGCCYALPQSPQIFKQLLMVAGMDRYYQVVKCFRDEDLRADRQPEFTQLDLEMSFIDETIIQSLMEEMIAKLFLEMLDIALPHPFPRMTYAESIERFGTDRPDLRIPLEFVEVGDLLKETALKIFSEPACDPNCRVTALKLPQGARLTRKEIEGYTQFVSSYGAKGLAYIKVNDLDQGREGLQSPILKFISEACLEQLLHRVDAKSGDILFFAADKATTVNDSLSALRVKLGTDFGLVEGGWHPVWIVDFPLFVYDDIAKRWQSLHHPFTSPREKEPMQLWNNPGNCLSRAYDLVLNGIEIGGGSIRINNLALQKAVFKLLGLSEKEAYAQFEHLLFGLKYGCPPHGGIAFGIDRLIMLMKGRKSIREVIAFPKTQSAHCPLTQAPAEVTMEQLRELGLRKISTGS
jgi:aspartyl-tRNA synthetase